MTVACCRWYFAMISISGIFSVTFSIVFAYVADVTTEEDRSAAYGLVSSVPHVWISKTSGLLLYFFVNRPNRPYKLTFGFEVHDWLPQPKFQLVQLESYQPWAVWQVSVSTLTFQQAYKLRLMYWFLLVGDAGSIDYFQSTGPLPYVNQWPLNLATGCLALCDHQANQLKCAWCLWQVSATFAASLVTSPAIGAYLGKIYSENLVVALASAVALLDVLFILVAVPESLSEKLRPVSYSSQISWEKADPFGVSVL